MTSAGSAGSAVSLSGGREVRACSVPALGISSMRLGVADEAEGRRGTLARRPPRDHHVPHRPPTRLELTGTRFGAEETNARSVAFLAVWESQGLLGLHLHREKERERESSTFYKAV